MWMNLEDTVLRETGRSQAETLHGTASVINLNRQTHRANRGAVVSGGWGQGDAGTHETKGTKFQLHEVKVPEIRTAQHLQIQRHTVFLICSEGRS